MEQAAAPTALPAAIKRALTILLIAKHARWDGDLHPADGSHALYHREMRTTLEDRGFGLEVADGYEALFERPAVDFVFPLLNRGGFLNSEMLLPLLCQRHGLPYLGASPILRGLSDDKHLTKRAAASHGLPTAPWAIYRRGAAIAADRLPAADRYVVKPNASSASWGVSAASRWGEVRDAIEELQAQGHDVIVEPFVPGHDIEVCVLTQRGQPVLLPVQIVEQDDPSSLRTYAEKRNLVDAQGYAIQPLADGAAARSAIEQTRALAQEFLPFDYGRFEFRMDAATGEVRFMEVNLNCNLWSRKTIALAAAQIGWSHGDLIETILAESLARQGLLARAYDLAA